MAYDKHTWVKGELIDADKMNNIESGIEGAVDKSGDTMTGNLRVASLNWPSYELSRTDGTMLGVLYADASDNKVALRGWNTAGTYYNDFRLPDTRAVAENNTYYILTTKSSITVEQGGTGAQTATAALSNLGGLAKSGGTMTGPLILAAEPNEELEAATKHYVDAIAAATGSGTVTSVRVAATSPVVSSSNTAQSVSLNTTISLADNYGDTKNPYASKTKNYVLAAPSDANGAPSFRALVAADIPSLSITDKTTGTLTVGRGGTGAASFTANSVIMSGSTTTAALTTRAVTNMTSVGIISYNTNLMTTNTLAFWNGAYNSNNASNLTYCNRGAFGDMATKSAANYWDTSTSRTANTVLAAPNGSAGGASFRALVAADLPTVTVAKGGTGATTAAAARTSLGIGSIATRAIYYSSTTTTTPSGGNNGDIYLVKMA